MGSRVTAGRPPRRLRRTAEVARRQILEAAERRLIAGGPEAIRLQDIARDVGISHPGVLHHFGSREGLIEALVLHGLQGFQAEVVAGWPSEQVPDVEGFFERFHRMAAKRGYARLLAGLILSGRELRALRPGILRPLVERMHAGRVRANLRVGYPAGEFDDTLFVAVLFATLLFGDALFGPLMRRSLGLGGEAAAGRFQRWLVQTVTRPPGRAGAVSPPTSVSAVKRRRGSKPS